MTQHFPQNFFPIVLNADRLAGLDLLRFYYERFGEWQADECAKTYILSSTSGDSEYLWALRVVITPKRVSKVPTTHCPPPSSYVGRCRWQLFLVQATNALRSHVGQSSLLARGHEASDSARLAGTHWR